MRKIISGIAALFLVTLLVSVTVKEEYFSGKIVYDIVYLSTKDGSPYSKPNYDFSPKQTYYADAKNYKSYRADGNLEQLYNAKGNVYYYCGVADNSVTIIDAAQGYGAAEVIKSNAKETILGYECSSITLKKIDSETTYFYSDKIKVDPKPFLNHYLGNWNQYVYETNGALPLKYTVKSKEYTMIATATSVEKMKFGKKFFDIDTEKPALNGK